MVTKYDAWVFKGAVAVTVPVLDSTPIVLHKR